jgi:orotidine-5'-phosphate decarboxylase
MEKEQIEKVFVALDNMSVSKARDIIEKYNDEVHGFKVNHLLMHDLAPYDNLNIFLDLKLWDIPNTVKTIVSHAIDLGVSYITISTLNNPRVFEDLKEFNRDIYMLGVTSLTSWTPEEEFAIHNRAPFWDIHISKIIHNFHGIICSVPDLKKVNQADPEHALSRICPGIRLTSTNDDQAKVATPTEAINAGADYLVMGRSFLNA